MATELKQTKITSIIKKPGLPRDNPLNFRPISNTSFLLKILDREAHHEIAEHLNQNPTLHSHQSGFRKLFGTETSLLAHKPRLLTQMEKSGLSLIISLDQSAASAAFDLIEHSILNTRLKEVANCSDLAASWIASFLEHRHSSVCSDTAEADSIPVLYGVP